MKKILTTSLLALSLTTFTACNSQNGTRTTDEVGAGMETDANINADIETDTSITQDPDTTTYHDMTL